LGPIKKKQKKQMKISKTAYKKIIHIGLCRSPIFYKALESWGVTGSDEVPPGIPTAIGLPAFRLRAIDLLICGGGGGFLLASQTRMNI